MTTRVLFSALVVLGVALVGCGEDTVAPPPPGPDTSIPATPQGLNLTTLYSKPLLEWLPNEDKDGDLAGYHVYRAEVGVGQPQETQQLTAEPRGESSYPIEGVSGCWVYSVRAVDRTGNQSPAANITVDLRNPAGGNEDPVSDEGTKAGQRAP